MKKLFLIPLMAMLCTVMAWGEAYEVNSFSALKNAIEQGNYPEVKLTADDIIRSTSENSCINITRSVTIDGDNHSITGYACRASNTGNGTLIAINHNGTDSVDVTIKNLTLNDEKLRAIETRGLIRSLTLENCTIKATGSGWQQPLTIGGNQASAAKINIINSHIECPTYYPIITFNPLNLTMTNSSTKGWCSVYFKGIDGSAGSHGTTMVATNCVFDAQNHNSGISNAFGAIVLEDDGIDITIDNCQFDCTADYPETGAGQTAFLLSEWKGKTFNRLQLPMNLEPCNVIIKGASTEIVGKILQDNWVNTEMQCPTTFTVYGGTFDRDISEDFVISEDYEMHVLSTEKDGQPITLYRVTKKAEEKTPGVMYDLNDQVAGEGVAEGNNPVSSFDLSTGTDMTLNNETTTAGYVQISDNVTTDPISGDPVVQPTTVTVGKTAGGDDQTLVVNAGLDVQGESQVIVEPGATLQIGEGGVTTEDPENIVIEANENGAASLLLNPEVIVNNTPELTVKMKAKQIGRNAEGQFMWHRFAMPVAHIDNWEKKGSLVAADGYAGGVVKYPTYLYGWDYANNDWANIVVGNMVPLQGYTLTLASDYIHLDGEGKVDDESQANGNLNVLQDVTYIFKGNLVGNTNQPLNFSAEGFNFFGNSYTGYIDVLTLIGGFVSNNVEGTVYMWCNDPTDEKYQSYVGVSLYSLQNLSMFLEDWQKEVAPMQTFILRLRGADSADETVDYASAIWGNPRYGNNTASPAPRRVVATNNIESHMAIVVKANGKGSRVEFTQDANYTDAFENGCDVVKYMNENTINLYATVNGEDLSSVVTNSLNGKLLSLQTNDDVNYTMSFKNVEGTEYAILDHTTNQMTVIAEGNTYQFAAQPNSTIEGRFEIVSINHMPTAIENTEVKASAKGIYTIMGQYVGEDFETLPAGVYVIDGVKIVK